MKLLLVAPLAVLVALSGCQDAPASQRFAVNPTVEGGSLVWSWYPDDAFVAASGYLIDVIAGL